MPTNPLMAYQQAQMQRLTGRELEAAVLVKMANLLKQCQANWGTPDNERRLMELLRKYQQVWTIFQAEIEKPDNLLPREIKVNLLRLIRFVDRRVFELMANPQLEKMQILIDINMNIAAGLSSRVGSSD